MFKTSARDVSKSPRLILHEVINKGTEKQIVYVHGRTVYVHEKLTGNAKNRSFSVKKKNCYYDTIIKKPEKIDCKYLSPGIKSPTTGHG